MNKIELIHQLNESHQLMIDYIKSLSPEKLQVSYNHKWSAAQQIKHLCLCLQPIAKGLAAKAYLIEKFGFVERAVLLPEAVINKYKLALKMGGHAPEAFVPPLNTSTALDLCVELDMVLKSIATQLESYTESELDSIAMPHPLLGKLSIRELIILMTYHGTHHYLQTKKNMISPNKN